MGLDYANDEHFHKLQHVDSVDVRPGYVKGGVLHALRFGSAILSSGSGREYVF